MDEKEVEALADYNQKMLTFVLQQIQLRLEKVDMMCEALIMNDKKLSKNENLVQAIITYNKMVKDIDNQAAKAITEFDIEHGGK